MSDFA